MEGKFYIYLHVKESTGEPFYVGKGKGNRAFTKQNRSNHWHNVVNKHGFDIIFLEKDLDEETAFEKEQYWIKRIGRNDLKLGPLVNFTDGGEGRSGGNISDKQRAALNKTGNVTSEETKVKISNSLKGRPSPMKGKESWNKGTKGIVKANSGTFKKGSEVGINTRFKKGCKSFNSKSVLNLETGIYYDSVLEAALAHGINHSTLNWQIRNNKHKTLVYAR